MQSTKVFFSLVVLASSVSLLTAQCDSACNCVAESAAFKALEERIARLEKDVVVETIDNEIDDEAEDKRLISDFFVELKMLRKEFLNRFRHVRKEIKEHAGILKSIKADFDALSELLGNPATLEAFGDRAESIFGLLVSLNHRIETLEKAIAQQ